MRLFPKSRVARIRAIVFVLALVGVLAYFFLIPALRYRRYAPQEGDILFQALPRGGEIVGMIEGVTESPYSHCGVVVNVDGEWQVIESIGDEVKKTPLRTWTYRGRGGAFAAFRLKEEHRDNIPEFLQELDKLMGRPYDWNYELRDEALYCSELIYKAYKKTTGEELGKVVKLGDLNWKPYEEAICKVRNTEDPPLDAELITPKHLSEAEQLERTYSGGL